MSENCTLPAPFYTQQARRLRKYHLSVPISNSAAAGKMHRALLRLRGVFIFNKELREIKTYGAGSGLVDVWGRYKANLSRVMEEKRRKVRAVLRCREQNVGRLFHPASLCLWQTLILAMVIWSVLTLPFLADFRESTLPLWLLCTEILVESAMLADILATLNTAIEDSGHLEVCRTRIFVQYLQGLLLFDCLSALPFAFLSGAWPLCSLIRISKIGRIRRCFKAGEMRAPKLIQKVLQLAEKHEVAVRLLGALGGMTLATHVTACLWLLSARSRDPETWVLRQGLQDESGFTLYLVSFYWAVTTVTTVGFGDLYADTESEKLIAMVWMLVGVGLYSFIVGTLSAVITGLGGAAVLIETRLQQVELFAKDTNLSRKTIRMVTAQVKSVTEGALLPEQPRIQLLQACSHTLRKAIVQQMHNCAASRVQLLSQLNMACLASLMPRTVRRMYEQDEVIYEKGEASDKVYFLLEGRVRCLVPGRGLLFKTLVGGSCFGEMEALEGGFREFTVEAATDCVLLELDRDALIQEMESFPDVRSKVLLLLEQRKEKDEERMEELLDLLEAVEIRHEATFQGLAGRAKVTYTRSPHSLFSVPALAISLSSSFHLAAVLLTQDLKALLQPLLSTPAKI